MNYSIFVISVSLFLGLVSCKQADIKKEIVGAWYVDDGYIIPDDDFLNHLQTTQMRKPAGCDQKGFFLFSDGQAEAFRGFWNDEKDNNDTYLGTIGSWEIRNDSIIIIDPLKKEWLKSKIIRIDKDTLFLTNNEKPTKWIRFRPAFHPVDFDSLHLNFFNGWNIWHRYSLFSNGEFNLTYIYDEESFYTGQIDSAEMKNLSTRLAYSDILNCSRETYSAGVDAAVYSFTIFYQGKISKKIVFNHFDAPMKTSWAILYVSNLLQQHASENCSIKIIRP